MFSQVSCPAGSASTRSAGSLTDALDNWLTVPVKLEFLGALVPIFVGLSGLGSLVLIRPQKGASLGQTFGPIVASVLYVPLVWMLWMLHARLDITAGTPYFTNSLRETEFAGIRQAVCPDANGATDTSDASGGGRGSGDCACRRHDPRGQPEC